MMKLVRERWWKRLFKAIRVEILHVAWKWWEVVYGLVRVLVPALLAVKLLDYWGGTEVLGRWLAPFMGVMELPGAMGLVWAAAILGNVQTGIAVFLVLMPDTPLTQAQMTVLMSIVLTAHSLPVEHWLIKQVGVRFATSFCLRVMIGLSYGILLTQIYRVGGFLQQPLPYDIFQSLAWLTPRSGGETTFFTLVEEIVRILGFMAVIILILVILIRLLTKGGVLVLLERWIVYGLVPLGISRRFTTITLMVLILGISYGAGFIITELKRNKPSPKLDREIFLLTTFLTSVHAIFEDTALVMIVGGHVTGVLVGRVIFVLVVVWLFKGWVRRLSDRLFYRYFCYKREIST